MARVKAGTGTMEVLVENTIADGEDGFLAVGDTFDPVDEVAAQSLKDKGFAK